MEIPRKKLVAIEPGAGRYANIVWQVSDVCNFRCSYCNEGNWGAKRPNSETEKYLPVLGKLIDHFQQRGYKAFKFFFSGGEPTIWKPLIPVLDFIYEKVDRPLIAVNTNLSRPLAWWEEHSHRFHDIVASFHVENTNKARYLENTEYLQYRVSYLALRMLMHDERFEEVVDFANLLKARLKNYTIEYAPLLEALTPHSPDHWYEAEWKRSFLANHSYQTSRAAPFSLLKKPHPAYSLEVYEDGSSQGLNSNRVVAEGQNQFQGWECSVGDNIYINQSGDITLASCGVGGVVGNINEGRLELMSNPVICPRSRCNCGTDICIPKRMPARMPSMLGAALA